MTSKSWTSRRSRTAWSPGFSRFSRANRLKLNAIRYLGQKFVPEGHSTIAQRFNAGVRQEWGQVPGGRQKSSSGVEVSFVPPGLVEPATHDPALKRWAIFTTSLRDEDTEFPNGIRRKPRLQTCHRENCWANTSSSHFGRRSRQGPAKAGTPNSVGRDFLCLEFRL